MDDDPVDPRELYKDICERERHSMLRSQRIFQDLDKIESRIKIIDIHLQRVVKLREHYMSTLPLHKAVSSAWRTASIKDEIINIRSRYDELSRNFTATHGYHSQPLINHEVLDHNNTIQSSLNNTQFQQYPASIFQVPDVTQTVGHTLLTQIPVATQQSRPMEQGFIQSMTTISSNRPVTGTIEPERNSQLQTVGLLQVGTVPAFPSNMVAEDRSTVTIAEVHQEAAAQRYAPDKALADLSRAVLPDEYRVKSALPIPAKQPVEITTKPVISDTVRAITIEQSSLLPHREAESKPAPSEVATSEAAGVSANLPTASAKVLGLKKPRFHFSGSERNAEEQTTNIQAPAPEPQQPKIRRRSSSSSSSEGLVQSRQTAPEKIDTKPASQQEAKVPHEAVASATGPFNNEPEAPAALKKSPSYFILEGSSESEDVSERDGGRHVQGYAALVGIAKKSVADTFSITSADEDLEKQITGSTKQHSAFKPQLTFLDSVSEVPKSAFPEAGKRSNPLSDLLTGTRQTSQAKSTIAGAGTESNDFLSKLFPDKFGSKAANPSTGVSKTTAASRILQLGKANDSDSDDVEIPQIKRKDSSDDDFFG